jgi:hypothetical protein
MNMEYSLKRDILLLTAKTCGKFCYISYNPESSTVIEGVHDDEIWEKIWDSINDLYSRDDTPRPTRNKPEQKTLLNKLIEYSKTCPCVRPFFQYLTLPLTRFLSKAFVVSHKHLYVG